ncbi:octanoyltransferase [Thermobispora bispora]|uniref:Octanoyltransferase n=1 Tax=Thermobispora bispora (strain ATCC 19993 / DSM 43833 / CBS 139.67 / JCM 10125 / KCTC 9307 / NBRC 14880 / R51) TaxID=469371 RepID=D6Y444_THEBD|nr:lipoyl(octanoyl) transferase LipB [Thermobispora bispora]MBO2475849.1 lipoate-protein ligase B [Actinomycetales bacterium]MDI9580472.1 lipoyl(octanoyl) transferase LipB [Thermobispora sp.]ADG87098.1 lipoate-protein ligase B [Thermobispora bispora DSM 43833]MBX6166714.1 lipoyl(octanoyl) transferase LipB [Thermobispora bispora]QSI47069.1 lipoyl(octanoyl) transferase LipB [Thermobispora bispora]
MFQPRPLALIQDDLVEYEKAMERMAAMVEERQKDERPDTLWLLSHPPVFTVGKRTRAEHLPDPSFGIPVVPTNRGGQLTYHGPGQLVGYLIVRLRPGEGIVDYIREVELRLVEALRRLGVPAERRDTPPGSELLTGVWTTNTNRKIVSIGMRSSRSVTSHGFALNVDGDLTPWTLAVPCGMPDVEMTSILRELGHASMEETRRVVAEVFEAS